MSGYVTHSSRAVFRWVLVLTFAVTTCGCTYDFYRFYDGPVKPLEEIAVLLAHPPIHIQKIDGKWAGTEEFRQFELLFWDVGRNEFHLAPGKHRITLHYSAGSSKGVEWVTVSHDFSKGHVYQMKASVPDWLFPTSWTPNLVHLGTVEEVAPRRAKEWLAPSHWGEFVER